MAFKIIHLYFFQFYTKVIQKMRNSKKNKPRGPKRRNRRNQREKEEEDEFKNYKTNYSFNRNHSTSRDHPQKPPEKSSIIAKADLKPVFKLTVSPVNQNHHQGIQKHILEKRTIKGGATAPPVASTTLEHFNSLLVSSKHTKVRKSHHPHPI